MKFNCDQCGTRYSIADEKVERKILRIRCKVCDYIMTVRGSDLRAQESVGISVSLSDSAMMPSDLVEWYAAPENRQVGPLSLDAMVESIARREIKPDTLVWNSNLDNWLPAKQIEELAEHFDAPGPPRSMPPPLPSIATGQSSAAKPGLLVAAPVIEGRPVDGFTDASNDAQADESISELSVDLLPDSPSVNEFISFPPKDDRSADKEPLGAPARSPLYRDTDVSPSAPDMLGEGPDEGDPDIEEKVHDEASGSQLLPAPQTQLYPSVADQTDGSLSAAVSSANTDSATPENVSASDARDGAEPSGESLHSSQPTDAVPSLTGIESALPSLVTHEKSVEDAPKLQISAEAAAPPMVALTETVTQVGPPKSVSTGQGAKPAPKISGLAVAAAISGVAAIGCIVWYATSSAPKADDSTKAPTAVVANTTPVPAPPMQKTVETAPDQGVADAAIAKMADASVVDAGQQQKTVTNRSPKRSSRKKQTKSADRVAKKTKDAARKEGALPKERKVQSRSFLMGVNGPKSQLPGALNKRAAPTSDLDDLPDGLTQTEIVEEIAKHRRSIDGCHQRQLKREPLRAGRIILRFTIRPTGRTANARIDEKFADTVLSRCLKATVRRWRFPRFRGEAVDVEYPLILTTSY